MSVYVDKLRGYTDRGTFAGGSCHLMAAHDADLEELHDFAKRLRLRRSWFQGNASSPHYDLTPRKREEAVRLGAVELDRLAFTVTCSRTAIGARVRADRAARAAAVAADPTEYP